jgi:hypothetical protein
MTQNTRAKKAIGKLKEIHQKSQFLLDLMIVSRNLRKCAFSVFAILQFELVLGLAETTGAKYSKTIFFILFKLWLHFYFERASYETKKQYYAYGRDEFVADFGGYLGLCLGMSLVTFYDAAVAMVIKIKDWTISNKKKNQEDKH